MSYYIENVYLFSDYNIEMKEAHISYGQSEKYRR